jgi:outer membrane protein OmpA-like peptidoglycan-associated protein
MANTLHHVPQWMRPALTVCLCCLLWMHASANESPIQPAPNGNSTEQSKEPPSSEAKVETKIENDLKIERSESTKRAKNRQSGTGYAYFGTIDLGFLLTSPTGTVYPSLEATQGGVALSAKLTGSAFTRRTALDLGIGMQYAIYKGKRIGKIVILQDENDNPLLTKEPLDEPYTRQQWGALFDGAARLRFKQNFQVGLVASGLFSPTSAEFNSLPENEAPQLDRYSVFLGPQILWESREKGLVTRYGLDFSVSLTGTKRTIYQTKLHAGWGEHLNDASTIVKNQKETKIKTKTVKETITVKDQQEEVQENITFIFDSQTINFKLNSFELTERSVSFVKDLSTAFLQDYDLWDKIVVEGHTDSRGSAEYNQKLSERRAQAIADELAKHGIPAPSLVVKGFGSSKPLVRNEKSELDFARNRRVEIKIISSKNTRRLQKRIEKIRANFLIKNNRNKTPEQE